jgi:hypothetical protein
MEIQLTDYEIEENATNPNYISSSVTEPTRSGLERFFDSFFHPANIKWMLVIGAAIVLGSSLMLVTKEWSEWSAAIKFFAILGYTAAIYVFAEVGDRRLGLKSTGNVLRALCILLMPIMFLVLGWVATQESSTGLPVLFEVSVLFLPATALLCVAGRNVFRHFLRGNQLTFLGSYALLATAGLLPRIANPVLAVICLACFWAVMTVGVIKVNRHVFWLTEEHRMPRIFGFFPILLLGAQFLMLCGTKLLFVAPPQWFGLATVMLAATVLGTTRSIASVFRARTGDLVRPLPWSIALPLFVGVLLAFVGVCVSFQGFHFVGPTTYAVVPTAIVAAALMMTVAYDTRHWGFTVLALVLVTCAYQCSPTLIMEWINALKDRAAVAVNEPTLPLAFYGITYLPLLAILTAASCWLTKMKRPDMSLPIQAFVTVVASLLWISSLSNVKATLVVAAINVFSFVAYGIAFRDRRYIAGTLAGIVVCAAVWVPFANAMFHADLNTHWIALSLSCVALTLYGVKFVDKLINWLPLPEDGRTVLFVDGNHCSIPIANRLGLAMLAGLGCVRLVWHTLTTGNMAEPASLYTDFVLMSALSLITYRKLHYLAGLATVILPAASAINFAHDLGYSWLEIGNVATMLAVGLSLSGQMILQWTSFREDTPIAIRRTFGFDIANSWIAPSLRVTESRGQRLRSWFRCHVVTLSDLGTLVTILSGVVVVLPNLLWLNLNWGIAGGLLNSASGYVMVWLVFTALIHHNRWAAGALAVIAPIAASAVVVEFWPSYVGHEWVPVIWVSVASMLCLAYHFAGKEHFGIACLLCRIWLSSIALVGFVYLSHPIRIAVAIAVATLLFARGKVIVPGERMFLAILCNVHALLFVANLAGAHGWVFHIYPVERVIAIAAALFPAMTLSILVSEIWFRKINVMGAQWWSANLRIISAFLFVALCAGPSGSLTTQCLVLLGIALAMLGELLTATRSQEQLRAWSTLVLFGLGIVWAWDQGWLPIGTGLSQLVLAVAAVLCLGLTKMVNRHPRFDCFANPLQLVGLVAPGAVTGLALGDEIWASLTAHRLASSSFAHSFNYMALLLSAAIYFFHGLSVGKRRYLLLSTVILNFGLALVWFSNGFTDPLFYCVPIGLSILWIVELLKKELPRQSHEPLRYIGALVILVSPVFGVLGSGWLHLFSLMVLCVLVILLAIGLRVRALMYTGTAFLLADIAGMLIRSSLDHPAFLWVGGIGLGATVIALAAICENHRENVLAKIRLLSSELAAWN